MSNYDTRIRYNTLMDYQQVYGEDKEYTDAANLIKNISSSLLLSQIAFFNIQLYLKDSGPLYHHKQLKLLSGLAVRAGQETIEHLNRTIQEIIQRGESPGFFWRYSNLVFYELILEHSNQIPAEELTPLEAEAIIKAYLIINSLTNKRLDKLTEELSTDQTTEEKEKILLKYFLYQRDYTSATDYSAQVSRGYYFFQFIENSDEFKEYASRYYAHIHINNASEIFYNILMIIQQIGIHLPAESWNALIDLSGVDILFNFSHLDTLLLNKHLPSYEKDNKFSQFRKTMILSLSHIKYLVLDISLLIDQLYKAQVFAFKAFIETNGYTGNFQSKKAKDFMEDIYFRLVMEKCFPSMERRTELNGLKIKGKEICDYYLRDQHNIMLIEFKDALLGADFKTGDKNEDLIKELEIKFSLNQENKAKGVRQLINAIRYFNDNEIKFDNLPAKTELVIYPVLVYTDTTFGFAGVNKILTTLYTELLCSLPNMAFTVCNVVFIDLTFFEVNMTVLKNKELDIFMVLNAFLEHIKIEQYSQTAFEAFAKEYIDEHCRPREDIPEIMKEVTTIIQNRK